MNGIVGASDGKKARREADIWKTSFKKMHFLLISQFGAPLLVDNGYQRTNNSFLFDDIVFKNNAKCKSSGVHVGLKSR